MTAFFSMGGFGAYVWSAMGVTALLMVLEPMLLIIKRRAVLQVVKRARRFQKRQRRGHSSDMKPEVSYETQE